jgi:hypothetical protein
MKIKKNKRGGVDFDAKNEMILSKESHIFFYVDISHSNFKNIFAYYNCNKQKMKTLLAVIMWLFFNKKLK